MNIEVREMTDGHTSKIDCKGIEEKISACENSR